MFKNMKLKSKMLLGYLGALLIIGIAMLFGIIGLNSNIKSFEAFTDLSDHSDLARAIETNLVESRLAYKKYMTTGTDSDIKAFELSYNRMLESIGSLRSYGANYDSESDFMSALQVVEDEGLAYKYNFEKSRDLDDELALNYSGLGTLGDNLLNQMEALKDLSYEEDAMIINKEVNDALQNLLLARLHGSKFYEFHTQEEYDEFLNYYNSFIAGIKEINQLDQGDNYEIERVLIMNDASLYQKQMQMLSEGANVLGNIEAEMDFIGPEILIQAETVVELINEQKVLEKAQLVSGNNQFMIWMTGLTLIAIILFILIVLKILKLVLDPIEYLTEAFESIAEGETDTSFRLAVNGHDEIGLMSKSFNKFIIKISAMMEDIQYQNRLESGSNRLHELARDEEDMNHLSEGLLGFIAGHMNGLVGRIYIKEAKGDYFVSTATYGTLLPKEPLLVNAKEGILSTCISEKKMLALKHIPDHYMQIVTGLGDTTPTEIFLLPCLYNEEVNGVIEIGRLSEFSELEKDLLKDLGDVIGNIIHSATIRVEGKMLLNRTIQQSEELQMQQEELRQSNEELEERSKQLETQKRALDEKNRAILESQDRILDKAYALEEANRYKSEFLANMSHELRTPLNSILVLSQLLGSRDNTKLLTDKEREFAKTIHTSGTDLLTLINGVLDLSKVEAGRLELIPEEIVLRELIREYERLFVSVAEAKTVDFITLIEEGIDESIVTDRLRLSQIIKNLVANAIKFTHEGQVTLTIREASKKECEDTGLNQLKAIAFEVKDTGIGIEADKREVIFEAFRQEDGTTSRTYGGTGLGLTIALELAKLLGGHIVLESEVGFGSRFVLIIPKIIKETQEKSKQTVGKPVRIVAKEKDLEANLSKVIGGSHQLLIIEDDQTFAKTLAALSEEKGYETLIASNGSEGIALARKFKPAAILLDMGLPDMDGMELAKKLGKIEGTKDIPIHIISGRDINDKETMPKSIIGFLKKPVDLKTIYKTLAKIENLNNQGLKNLLVVGYCGGESFENFANLGDVEVMKVKTGEAGLEALKQGVYGCVVLDTKLEDMMGLTFISKANETVERKVPIIIYTDEDINFDEYEDMNQKAESIILKSEKSRERLTEEVSLFLHEMNSARENYQGVATRSQRTNVKLDIEDMNDFNGKKVLLVDDDERNVFALLHALEQKGLEVIVAKDGFDAIDKFEVEPVDIILMDIMMPKMDGYEAIRRIRALKNHHNGVPIIALTAKAMSEDRDRCIQAGANDYMTKPIDVDKLMSLMKVWMR